MDEMIEFIDQNEHVQFLVSLDNAEAFIRQINLKKKKSEKLVINFSGSFKKHVKNYIAINLDD